MNGGEPVIIFGASKLGELAYYELRGSLEITGFCDNDQSKQGQEFCGLPVINPNELTGKKARVLIASGYALAIIKQLIAMGVKDFSVFTTASQGGFSVQDYDYRCYDSFEQNTNRISLLVENNSGSNTLALYKLMPEYIREKYDIRFLAKSDTDRGYYYDLITSKMVVSTHDMAYDRDQLNIQLWHGCPLKGLSYMSRYQQQNAEWNHLNWQSLAVVASYSTFYTTLMNACYGLDVSKYRITGMPRNDLLFGTEGRSRLEELTGVGLAGKKMIFFVPTFRRSISGECNGECNNKRLFDVAGFDNEIFNKFLAENNLALIIKSHPFEESGRSNNALRFQTENIRIIREEALHQNNLDFYELLSVADLLITDYSSVYFDYLLLERPIIFTPVDLEVYRASRGLLLEPYDDWTPGPKCFSMDSLTREIQKSLADREYYASERNRLKRIVHYYQDADSSMRVWMLIDQMMSHC